MALGPNRAPGVKKFGDKDYLDDDSSLYRTGIQELQYQTIPLDE
jgi:hypothetical protein